MNKDTGGPAFPELGNVGYNSDWQNENGMTLRDYFAGQALAGFAQHPNDFELEPQHKNIAEAMADQAYFLADAMIAERGKA